MQSKTKESVVSPPTFYSDITITYVNNTRRNDFTVVVFEKSPSDERPSLAWHAIKAQSSAQFVYQVKTGVGAYWRSSDGVNYRAGPKISKVRMVWDVCMPSEEAPATLEPDVHSETDPGSIMIKNVQPMTWIGRTFNLGLYKGTNLLLAQENVPVKGHAKFSLSSMLSFGVQTKNISRDKIFELVKDLEGVCEIDLNDFSNGVIMELRILGGNFKFIPKQPWQLVS